MAFTPPADPWYIINGGLYPDSGFQVFCNNYALNIQHTPHPVVTVFLLDGAHGVPTVTMDTTIDGNFQLVNLSNGTRYNGIGAPYFGGPAGYAYYNFAAQPAPGHPVGARVPVWGFYAGPQVFGAGGDLVPGGYVLPDGSHFDTSKCGFFVLCVDSVHVTGDVLPTDGDYTIVATQRFSFGGSHPRIYYDWQFNVSMTFPTDTTGPPPPPPTPDDGKGDSVSYDVSDARRHARAFVATGSEVRTGLASNIIPIDWTDRGSGLTASSACIRWDRQSLSSALFLFTESSQSLKLYKSVNEGFTWTLATTIGTGKHPALVIARDGRRYCYYVSSGAIKGKVLDPSGATVIDTFTAVASGVDDDSIAADEFTLVQSKWGIALLYRSSGTITTKTSNDGIIFS